MMYPLSGFKFVFATSVLLCMLGWYSVVRTLHFTGPGSPLENMNCSNQKQQQLLEFKEGGGGEYSPKSRALSLASSTTTTTASNSLPLPVLADAVDNSKHQPPPAPHKRRLRVLMGIFTLDKHLQFPYRRQFRKLFEIFPQYNDTRVCSLHEFETAPTDEQRYQCQFIYTFVVGGLKRKAAPTEHIDNKNDDENPILLPRKDFIIARDLKDATDTTFLNIRENMNDGKSQTWFKYAAQILDKYDLDYAGKLDSDSLPYLDKFFQYAYQNLPPPPYNSGIIAGVPIDKLWWSKTKTAFQNDKAEQHFKKAYGKVMHLYAAGQCYILSKDLCHTVVLEAPKSKSYREGHEDHDISAMAFRSKRPINFHFLSLQQQFWKHPVKRYKKKVRKWRTLWHNEQIRMKKVLERRQEQLRKAALEAEKAAALAAQELEDEKTPDQLAAPVQMELEDNDGEEEEEEEDDEDGEEEEDGGEGTKDTLKSQG